MLWQYPCHNGLLPNCGSCTHYQSWSLSDDPQRYSPSWRSQDTKVSKTPLDQFLNTPLLANLRHRQGEEARRQHKKTFPRRFVSPAVDHARIGKIIPAAYVSHLQNSAGKFIKCLLLKASTVPSLYINNKRATEWGTICQRAESIFRRPTLCGRIHGTNWVSGTLVGPCPWVPSPHPLCPVCAGPHQGPTCHTISPVLSSPETMYPSPSRPQSH